MPALYRCRPPDYLWDIPEVSLAVSGMGSMADVEANLDYALWAKPNMLSPDEREALGAAIRTFRQTPEYMGLDIPDLLVRVKETNGKIRMTRIPRPHDYRKGRI